jgi:hypothetical protein
MQAKTSRFAFLCFLLWTSSGMSQLPSEYADSSDSADPTLQNTELQYASLAPSSHGVELLAWSATCIRGRVILAWTTTPETENLGFILERRMASSAPTVSGWSWVGSFATDPGLASQGSNNQMNHYRYVDNDVQLGETYEYFLSNVDFTGKFTKLAPVSISVQENPPPDQRLNFRLGANGSAPPIPSTRIHQARLVAHDVH